MLHCYYTEEPCNKKIKKKFRPALKITAMISRQKMSKEDGRYIFLAGSKMSLWDSHNFFKDTTKNVCACFETVGSACWCSTAEN